MATVLDLLRGCAGLEKNQLGVLPSGFAKLSDIWAQRPNMRSGFKPEVDEGCVAVQTTAPGADCVPNFSMFLDLFGREKAGSPSVLFPACDPCPEEGRGFGGINR